MSIGVEAPKSIRSVCPVAGGARPSGAGVDVLSPSGEQFEIAYGDQRAVVVEVGGGLRTYSAAGRELLDGYPADERITSGRGQVLLPWPNRLQDGTYEFDGRHHQLPLTEPEHRNAIHGLVRWAGWRVAERELEPGRDGARDSSSARLPVLARRQHRVRALRPGTVRRDDGHERRPGPVPVRVRRPSVPDPRDTDRRLRSS